MEGKGKTLVLRVCICREGLGNELRPGLHRVQSAVKAGQLSSRPGLTSPPPTPATIPVRWDGLLLQTDVRVAGFMASGIFPCFNSGHLRDGTDHGAEKPGNVSRPSQDSKDRQG